MHIEVTDEIALTEFRPSNKAACVERIGDRAIYEHTLRIPHPYTPEHFDQWLDIVAEATRQHGEPIHFVIRERGELIGSVGFEDLAVGHKAEIGYWLAKAWWGRGIMTAVVASACRYAFARWQLMRITAHMFESNLASARVLEKNSFACEGLLRKYYRKDGQFLNSRLYALVW